MGATRHKRNRPIRRNPQLRTYANLAQARCSQACNSLAWPACSTAPSRACTLLSRLRGAICLRLSLVVRQCHSRGRASTRNLSNGGRLLSNRSKMLLCAQRAWRRTLAEMRLSSGFNRIVLSHRFGCHACWSELSHFSWIPEHSDWWSGYVLYSCGILFTDPSLIIACSIWLRSG